MGYMDGVFSSNQSHLQLDLNVNNILLIRGVMSRNFRCLPVATSDSVTLVFKVNVSYWYEFESFCNLMRTNAKSTVYR